MCGSDAHELEACPVTPKGPLEVIVEKFGATNIHSENELSQKSPSTATPPTEKWITVVPKKRGRPLPLPKRKSAPQVVVAPASPTVKLMPSSSLSETPDGLHTPQGTRGVVLPPAGVVEAETTPVIPISQPVAAHVPLASTVVGEPSLPVSSLALAPAGSGTTRPLPSPVLASSPASPLEGSDLEDDDVTMFLILETEEDVQLSSDSTKKRRLDEGDAASPSTSLH